MVEEVPPEEPKLAASEDDVLQRLTDAEPASVSAQDDASADAASAARPGILKQEGGRSQSDPSPVPAASDASAAAADDNFGHLTKESFVDDDPASASAGASGAFVPLLSCGDCQRAHCGKQFTNWEAARKHRQQMHRCRYCWQLFQKQIQAGGFA